MARKITKREAEGLSAPQGADGEAAKAARQAADDIATLHPHASLTLRGRTVMAREYGYIEGLSLQAGIKPLLTALYGLFSRAADAPPSAAQVREVFAAQAVTLQWVMAQAITPYPEDPAKLQEFGDAVAKNARWIATLDDIEGDALLTVWWSVNCGFFIRRFREQALAAREAEARTAPQGSTPT